MYFWDETFSNSWYVGNMLTFTIALNITWCLNSFSHTYGRKPYDKNIRPTETPWLGMFGIGEGWHNYHHTFPWDYKNSEFRHFELKYIIRFIDFFAAIGEIDNDCIYLINSQFSW
jgi:stearoyl-CoA desaturase (delta-9 desaturase)